MIRPEGTISYPLITYIEQIKLKSGPRQNVLNKICTIKAIATCQSVVNSDLFIDLPVQAIRPEHALLGGDDLVQ